MTSHYGYAGKIARVDLSTAQITEIPTKSYSDRFVGGKGIAAKIYWDEVSPETGAFDLENRLIFIMGPVAGATTGTGTRCVIASKSPRTVPEQFCFANLGGTWGAQLRLAGYDGIVIQGKSDRPVYLFVRDSSVEIRDASSVWGKTTVEAREDLQADLGRLVRVVACGPAGENKVLFANAMASDDSSMAGGFGAVMGSKKLKAIAVSGNGRVTAASPERLRQIARSVDNLVVDRFIPASWKSLGLSPDPSKVKAQRCYGCRMPCWRITYQATDGTRGKFMCQSAQFYMEPSHRYYGEENDVPFYANRICDIYGLSTTDIAPLIDWLQRCYKSGILTDQNTGIPLSKVGSQEFIETLVKKIALREGFGDILALGMRQAATMLGRGSTELVTDYHEGGEPRILTSTALLYAMEPARPPEAQWRQIGPLLGSWAAWERGSKRAYLTTEVLRAIASKFFGSELAVDFSTYDGKALAAKMMQDREIANSSVGFCAYAFPMMEVKNSEDHVGDPTLESQIFSAVTGIEMDEQGLYEVGERIFNLQRAIYLREGHRARESDMPPAFYFTDPVETCVYSPKCLATGKDGETISLKGAVLDREKFVKMRDEYYQLRRWDVTSGLQTRTKLKELGLDEVANDLEQRKLVVVS